MILQPQRQQRCRTKARPQQVIGADLDALSYSFLITILSSTTSMSTSTMSCRLSDNDGAVAKRVHDKSSHPALMLFNMRCSKLWTPCGGPHNNRYGEGKVSAQPEIFVQDLREEEGDNQVHRSLSLS